MSPDYIKASERNASPRKIPNQMANKRAPLAVLAISSIISVLTVSYLATWVSILSTASPGPGTLDNEWELFFFDWRWWLLAAGIIATGTTFSLLALWQGRQRTAQWIGVTTAIISLLVSAATYRLWLLVTITDRNI